MQIHGGKKMSDVVVILEKLKEEGFSLWLDGEKLRYKAPKSVK